MKKQKNDEGGGKGDDAGQLGRFEAEGQADVVAAQKFQKEPFRRIKHDVQAEDLSFFMGKTAVEQ